MKSTLVKIFAISSIATLLAGCALFGSDIQGLYDIKEAHTKVFDKDISRCYVLAAEALKKWKAVIFQQDKDDYMVAMEFEKVFRGSVNTTELGIFFNQTGSHTTEIKVTSLNRNLSQFIAPYLFNYIEKDGNVPKEEGLEPSKIAPSRNFLKNK